MARVLLPQPQPQLWGADGERYVTAIGERVFLFAGTENHEVVPPLAERIHSARDKRDFGAVTAIAKEKQGLAHGRLVCGLHTMVTERSRRLLA